MCFVSSPKVNTNPPPPEFLHNQYLDSAGPDGTGANRGIDALTIPLASQTGLAAPTATTGGSQQTANVPAVGGPAQNAVAAAGTIAAPAAPTPGVVTPTIGGSIAGAIPAYMHIGGAVK